MNTPDSESDGQLSPDNDNREHCCCAKDGCPNPDEGPSERRQGKGRRADSEVNRRSGWDRRRGPGRRRSDERRAAEEGEMTDEQFEFIKAIDQYKQVNRRPFPSFTEALEIAKALGYRRVAEPQPLSAPVTNESSEQFGNGGQENENNGAD